jgi:hypothetical protein
MKKTLLTLLLIPHLVFAERSPEIKQWVEVNPEKGYILSVDLYQSKQCSQIWSKQIKEFKKHNPQIKDPNVILVHQKIKVQSCEVKKVEVAPEALDFVVIKEAPPADVQLDWFFTVYGGASFLSNKSDDTGKTGYSLGAKVGRNFHLNSTDLVQVGIGFLHNRSSTANSNNILGEYVVHSELLTLDAAWIMKVSDSWKLGPIATMVISDDVSMNETNKSKSVGGYLGANALYGLSKSMDLDLNFQQSLEDRLNLLVNVGVKFNF